MTTTIKDMVIDVLPDLWPVIIIITVIFCSFRIAYLMKNKQKFCFYKELFNLMFILYVMCLFEVVTLQDDNYGLSNFLPFKEMFRYEFGSRLFIKNIVGNVLLFSAFICTAINVIANWMNKKSRIWFIPGALAISWGIAWSISLYMTNNFGIYTGDITMIQLFENMFSTIGLDSVISMTPELPKISIGLLVFALFIINSKLSKDLDKGYIDVE